MSGDYTRVRFDPINGFSGVHKQQGRVSLDAEFNEFEEILDRRARSEMFDIVGAAVVPLTTKLGFQIGFAGGGLTIGRGRAYVDGIQAECFGDLSDPTKTVLDVDLNGVHGPDAVGLPYAQQPFYYSVPAFPALSGGPATDLVYLDVWQREVTVYERPDLLEQALNGADTATRVQTAWQVKVLQGVPDDACKNDPASWTTLTAPSTARLTASVTPAPPAPGPCTINPAGGYTGLENRLYRIEVHAAGTLGGAGKATFKWSRDNASLVASVTAIKASGIQSVITVDTTGRDSWKRFSNGDTIELLDDLVEYSMHDTGASGSIAKIVSVNDATGEITIDTNLSAFAIVPGRHPRIRRWDVAKPGDAAVRNVGNGVSIPLEEGISITFSAADTDTLHAGDYWVFAARTADGTIDPVIDAPPRGILHHYAKLGVVSGGAVQHDCRTFWPPPSGGGESCECTRCVTEESHSSKTLTIQMAVNQVIAAGGGTVCICTGTFVLDDTVTVANAVSLRIRGEGTATRLVRWGDKPALAITSSIDVAVSDLLVATARDGKEAWNAVEIGDSAAVALERAVVAEDVYALFDYLENRTTNRPLGAAVALYGLLANGKIRECVLAGQEGVAGPYGGDGDPRYLVTADLGIEDNLLFARGWGVLFGGLRRRVVTESGRVRPATFQLFADQTRISRNSIFGCEGAAIQFWGSTYFGRVNVADNVADVRGSGIIAGANCADIAGNAVVGLGSREATSGTGIALVASGESELSDCRILANRVDGFSEGGIGLETDLDTVLVKQNIVERSGGGVVMAPEVSATALSVANNVISEISAPPGGDDSSIVAGIMLVNASASSVLDNVVRRVGTGENDKAAGLRAGIQLATCPSVRVAGNQVDEIGQADSTGVTAGIASTVPYESLEVVDNRVGPSPVRVGEWFALLIEEQQQSLPVFYIASTVSLKAAPAFVAAKGGLNSVTGVRGNVLEAVEYATVARVFSLDNCVFAENRCNGASTLKHVPVQLKVKTLALTSNHVLGSGDDTWAVVATVTGKGKPHTKGGVQEAAATVLGNLTRPAIELNGQILGGVWAPLNLILV